MARQLGFAGVQMEISPGDNIERLEARLARISDETPWVELVLFSELCLFGNDPRHAQPVPGPATGKLGRLARKYGKWLVPGSLYETAEGGFFNTAPVFNPDGELVVSYRKLYPWQPNEKSLAGDGFCVFDIPGKVRVGLMICYDQWFPEVTRQLVWMGAEVIVHPVMTTTGDRPLELVLSRANAIANQVYFLSVNGLGAGGNGRSILVDPEGGVLHQAGEEEEIMAYRLDLDMVERVRHDGTMGLCRVWQAFETGPRRFPVYCGDGPGED